jgi:hypothetical protein
MTAGEIVVLFLKKKRENQRINFMYWLLIQGKVRGSKELN